jgi:hypothetical protein
MSKNAPMAFPVVTSPVVAKEVTARVGGLFGVERPAGGRLVRSSFAMDPSIAPSCFVVSGRDGYSETARGRHPGRCALGKGFADPSEEFLLAFEQ